MRRTLHDQLCEMTVVVADTGDINAIQQFKPRDATTNPSLITAAAQMEEYRDVVASVLRESRREVGANDQKVVDREPVEESVLGAGPDAVHVPGEDLHARSLSNHCTSQ